MGKRGPQDVRVLDDGFECDQVFYPFSDVLHLGFRKEVETSSMNGIPTNRDFTAHLTIFIKSERKPLEVKAGSFKAFYLFRKRDRAEEVFAEIEELYVELAEGTFGYRLRSYESELDRRGFFTYDSVRFHHDGRIESGKHSLYLSDVSISNYDNDPFRIVFKGSTQGKGLRALAGGPSILIDCDTDYDVFAYLLNQIN